MARANSTPIPRLAVVVAAAGLLLGEIAVLPGAASPFRLPKEAVVLAALSLAVAITAFVSARLRVVVTPRGPLLWLLLALPGLLWLSTAWSVSPGRSLESAALTALWVAGTLWLATLKERQRQVLWRAAVIGAVVSGAVMFLQLAGVEVFTLAGPSSRGRLALTGLTGNPADLAMALVLLLPQVLVWCRDSQRPVLARATAAFLVLTVLVTQTLTGAAALFAVGAVWLVQQRSRRLWTGACVAALVIVVAALALGLGSRLRQAGERAVSGDWYGLFSARADGWTAAAQMIGNAPVIGSGAASFSYLYYPSRLEWLEAKGGVGRRGELQSHFEWAHCDPLQLVAEIGLLGVVWMAALVWALFRERRAGAHLLPLTAAAAAPFLLLHYPTHIAVGLVPLSLCLAQVLAGGVATRPLRLRWVRMPIALLLVLILVSAVWWQVQRVAADLWIGGLELRMSLARQAPPEARQRLGAVVAAQVLQRMDAVPTQAASMWRTVGRARLLAGDARAAENAFRKAYELWPHEDAEFYLGISLAAQGRRGEALAHLGRVCRTNPRLTRLIADDTLRRAVEDQITSFRGL